MSKLKIASMVAWVPAALVAAACGSGGDVQEGPGGSGSPDGGALGPNGAGAGGVSGAGVGAGGPQYPGAGTGFSGAPLPPGVGPETAGECSTPAPIDLPTDVTRYATTCFFGDTPSPEFPAATIEAITEVQAGREVIHIRITFDPRFVDNSYGVNAIGWGATEPAPEPAPMGGKAPKGAKGGHTFRDLVGSDHVEVQLTDGSGGTSLHVKLDYISEDPDSPCGYGTLGVSGGEGEVLVGDASHVLEVATSLDRDLNGCGYCLTESSPATGEGYEPSADAPKWDYRVVYEFWVDAAAFGSAGFGEALIQSVHASPSKLDTNTVEVVPKPCPPGWDVPYCIPGLSGEGIDCGSGAGGSSGYGGAGGYTGAGGYAGTCPPGWVPDLATEGRTCVPG